MWLSSLRTRAGYLHSTRYLSEGVAEHTIKPWPPPGAGFKKKPRGGRRRGRKRQSQRATDALRRIEFWRREALIDQLSKYLVNGAKSIPELRRMGLL